MKRSVTLFLALMALMVVGEALPASAAVAKPEPIVYNSIPKNLPGNVSSQAFQATQTSEFGDAVSFVPGSTDQLKQVTVVMSSWACQSGTWSGGDCHTNPGATFAVPITLTLYNYVPGSPATAGSIIASSTRTFHIQYRPSADAVNCQATPAKWHAADGFCYNGLARRISFAFGHGVTLPSHVVYGVAYDTSGFGLHPKGYDTPCNSTEQGCAYDSLNVGAAASTPTRGTDVNLDGAFLNSVTDGQYCDGGSAGTGSFRLDDGCRTGFNPMVRFKVFAG